MSLIIRKKVNSEIVSYEIKTIHKREKNNVFFISGIINYDLIKAEDIDELIKLFYLTKYLEDFDLLYLNHMEYLKPDTKLFLLNHAYNIRHGSLIKKYVVELPIELINKKQTEYDVNILECLCMHRFVISSHPAVKSFPQINYPGEDLNVLELVEFILQNKPELISERCYALARSYKNNQIIKLLNNYQVCQVDTYDLCYICSAGSEPERIINDICECKMNIHYHCAQELIQRSRDNKCKTCNAQFKRNMPLNHIGMLGPVFDNKVYFPHLGVFPVPLCGGYQILSKENRLQVSIIYLQYKYIAKLHAELTPDELVKIKEQLRKDLSWYNGFGRLTADGGFELLENTCSNAPRELNPLAHTLTELIVNKLFI